MIKFLDKVGGVLLELVLWPVLAVEWVYSKITGKTWGFRK